MTNEQGLMTLAESASFLHVAPSTARVWEQKGRIKPVPGAKGPARFSRDSLRFTTVVNRQRRLLSIGYATTAAEKVMVEQFFADSCLPKTELVFDANKGTEGKHVGMHYILEQIASGSVFQVVLPNIDTLAPQTRRLLSAVCELNNVLTLVLNL